MLKVAERYTNSNHIRNSDYLLLIVIDIDTQYNKPLKAAIIREMEQ